MKTEQSPPKHKVTVIDDAHPQGIPYEQWAYNQPHKKLLHAARAVLHEYQSTESYPWAIAEKFNKKMAALRDAINEVETAGKING